MISKTIAKVRQHPGMTMLLSLGAAAGAAVAILNFTGVIDQAVISHAELAEVFRAHVSSSEAVAHPAAQIQMDLIRQESRCGSLDIQIAILSDVIWRLEQSEPNGQRLREKNADMIKLKERRNALKCAELA